MPNSLVKGYFKYRFVALGLTVSDSSGSNTPVVFFEIATLVYK